MHLDDIARFPYEANIPEDFIRSLPESCIVEYSSSGFDTGAPAVGTAQTQAVLYRKCSCVVSGMPFFDAVRHAVRCDLTWVVNESVPKRVQLVTVTRASREWYGRLAMTRKTTAGFRAVQKYAVVVGGMDPHRNAIPGMWLLKNNRAEEFILEELGKLTE